ncbi:LUD domain-containing protein [Streptomyces sp. RCPT1-4]|nr:LUD domain-containing protein [Streptomyces sennicomposti]
MSARQLDSTDTVVTGCAVDVAETGTIVLDGGWGQGRRALTLAPDLHVVVVRAPDQVVASVPTAASPRPATDSARDPVRDPARYK